MHPVRRMRRWLRKRKKVKKSNSFVEAALSEHIPNYNGIWAPLLSPLKGREGHESLAKEMAEEKGVWRIPLDGKFWLLPEKQMKEVIKKDHSEKKKYYADKFDCDNYSFMFITHLASKYGVNGAGIVLDFSGAHAYNFVVYPRKKDNLRLFEPQNDSLFKVKKRKKKFYPLETALVLI